MLSRALRKYLNYVLRRERADRPGRNQLLSRDMSRTTARRFNIEIEARLYLSAAPEVSRSEVSLETNENSLGAKSPPLTIARSERFI